MINEQLLQYIKSQRKAGAPDEEIKENLSAAGWRDEDIAEGFEAVSKESKTSPQGHQKIRQEATEDRQKKQADNQAKTAQGDSSTTSQSDQYRETVESEDRSVAKQEPAAENQQSDTSSQTSQTQPQSQEGGGSTDYHAANENPQELRTMEEDKKRFGKKDTQQENNDKPSTAEKSGQSAGKKKDKPKQKQDQPKKQKKASASEKQKKKNSSSGYHPTQAKQERQSKSPKQSNTKSGSHPEQKKHKQSSGRSQVKQQQKKRATRGTAKKRQKQRKSQIQQARQESSSANISAIILSVLALILIGGGAAYAYLNYFQGPTAETNAQEVMQSLADSETFEYRIGVGRQSEEGSTNEEMVVVEGAVDLTSEGESYYTIRRPSQPGGSPVMGTAPEFSEFSTLDPRQQQTINQTLLQPEFFTVREFQTQQQLGATENSSGFNTNRFGVMANPNQLTEVYNTIYETIYTEPISSPVWSTLQENLGGFEPQQGQLWVHPTSSVPYQITFIGTGASGENLQVNMQFRNHGAEVSSAPRTYESRPFISGLADALNSGSTDDDPDLPTDQSTSSQSTSTPEDDQQTSSDEDSSDTGSDSDDQQNVTLGQDRLRINDLQQLQIALKNYASENGNYPANLNELASSQSDILPTLPTDPQTNNPYAYAVNQAQTVYHIGATLKTMSGQQAPDDADYNSTTGSFSGGFDGSGGICQTSSQSSEGSACYDLRGIISASGN